VNSAILGPSQCGSNKNIINASLSADPFRQAGTTQKSDSVIVHVDDIFLIFSVPPQQPILLDGKGTPVGSMLGPLSEGESVELTCRTFGG
jgi:hypothetical protein